MKLSQIIVALLLLTIITSCNTTKFLKEGEYFYEGATIAYDTPDSIPVLSYVKDELDGALTPSPNSQVFGQRLGVWYYFKGEGKKKGLKKFMKKKFGEKPVLYSERTSENLTRLLKNKLDNNGYFDAEVFVEPNLDDEKRIALPTYQVKITQKPYAINNVYRKSVATELEQDIDATRETTLLWKGQNYQLAKLRAERDLIDSELKDKGYYYFNPEFLEFKADSTIGDRSINLSLGLKPKINPKAYNRYKIGKITIQPDYDIDNLTISKEHKTIDFDEFTYIGDPHNMRPEILKKVIWIEKGDFYSRENHQRTLRHISSLDIFKYIDLRFIDVSDSISDVGTLDLEIKLSQITQKSLEFELGAASWDIGLAGPEANLTWRHRNIFGGAEVLSINGSLALQQEFGGSSAQTSVERLLVYGFETKLAVPRILAPLPVHWKRGKFLPHTNFQFSLQRYDFKLPPNASNEVDISEPKFQIDYLNLSYGFDWKPNENVRHRYRPAVISFQFKNDPENYIDSLSQTFPFLNQTFRDQFILGTEYNYTYDSSPESMERNRFFFRGGLDLSGNLLYLFDSNFGSEERENLPENPYTFFGQPYSQYVRPSVDFRYFYHLGKKAILASKFMVGLGNPWGNSLQMPFSKQYYVGGANSVRAFRSRTVGPGSFVSPTNSQDFAVHAGDIKIETSVEYRYDMSKYIKWAYFIDAGNVWMKNPDESRPGAEFVADKFFEELAIGTGMGFRLDLTFFVLRLDFAFPLKVPYYVRYEATGLEPPNDFKEIPLESQWVVRDFSLGWLTDNTVINFAIGYPF